VLDRPQKAAFTLAEMELLGLFANEAAIASTCSGHRSALCAGDRGGGRGGGSIRRALADADGRKEAAPSCSALWKLLRER
jgi:hypothetical protein